MNSSREIKLTLLTCIFSTFLTWFCLSSRGFSIALPSVLHTFFLFLVRFLFSLPTAAPTFHLSSPNTTHHLVFFFLLFQHIFLLFLILLLKLLLIILSLHLCLPQLLLIFLLIFLLSFLLPNPLTNTVPYLNRFLLLFLACHAPFFRYSPTGCSAPMEMSLLRLVKSIYGTCLLHFHKNAFANFINVQGCRRQGGGVDRGRGAKLIAKHCEICETEFTCTGDSLALLQLISKVSASCTGRRSPLPPPLSRRATASVCLSQSLATVAAVAAAACALIIILYA